MDLVVGRVAKSHGIRGEVVVDIRTDAPEERFAVGTVLRGRRPRGGGEQNFTVTAARHHAGRLLLSLDEIGDRTAADAIRGTLFLIDSASVDSGSDPDEFYDHELEGLPVTTVAGAEVGKVSAVLHLPGGELLSVTAPDGREILVPFVRDIVPTVTRDGIEIDPPDGLLEDLDADTGATRPESADDQG